MKITPTDKKLIYALESDGDMCPRDLAELLEYENHVWIARKMRRLLAAELVRVSHWIRNTDGLPIPVYSITPGESKKRPGAQGWGIWSKRYRKRVEEKGGDQYLKAKSSLSLLVQITSRRMS